jgi:hypothetical protein
MPTSPISTLQVNDAYWPTALAMPLHAGWVAAFAAAPSVGGGGGGGGVTNLTVTNRNATTLDIASDTGADATIPAATGLLSGLMAAADKTKLDSLSLTLANGAVTTPVLANGAVTNVKIANSPALTMKGNNTSTESAPVDLTIAQINSLLGISTQAAFYASGVGTGGSVDITIPTYSGTLNGLSVTQNGLKQFPDTYSLPTSTTLRLPATIAGSNIEVMLAGGIKGSDGAGLTDGDKGGVIVSSGGTVIATKDGTQTNAKLANMAGNSLKANLTGSAAIPTDFVVPPSTIPGRGPTGNLVGMSVGVGLSITDTQLLLTSSSIANIQNIAALMVETWPNGRPEFVFLRTSYYSNDGGRLLRWNSAATNTHDGGRVIKEDATVTGRWLPFNEGIVTPAAWYGVNPSNTGSGNSAAFNAVCAGAPYGIVQLMSGVHNFNAGVMNITREGVSIFGAAQDLTILRAANVITNTTPLIACNDRTSFRMSDLTLDGDAKQLLTRGKPFSTPLASHVVSIVAGKQYRVAMRGTIGATVVLSGAGTSGTLTGAGYTPSTSVTSTFVASATGSMTLTVTGEVGSLSVVENANTGLGTLFATAYASNVVLNNVSLINFDRFGWASNACSNLHFIGTSKAIRHSHSWEQNVGILYTWVPGVTARHGKFVIGSSTSVLNTGIQGIGDDFIVEDGATIGGTGYGATIAPLQGHGRFLIGVVNYIPNQQYWDIDETVPNALEVNGGPGFIMRPMVANGGGTHITINGDITVIEPWLSDGSKVFAFYSQYASAIAFRYVSSTINSNGAKVVGGRIFDTLSGAARTLGYGVGDESASVSNTAVHDVQIQNMRLGSTNFLGATARSFRAYP